MINLNQAGQDLNRKTAGLQGQRSVFQSGAAQLGLGGRAQGAYQQQRREAIKGVGDIAKRQQVSRQQQGTIALDKSKEQLSQNIYEQQEELNRARQYAQEDVTNFFNESSRQRNIYLTALNRQKIEMKEQLEGMIDNEQLQSELQGYDSLATGLTRGAMAGIDAYGNYKGKKEYEDAIKRLDVSLLPAGVTQRPTVPTDKTTEAYRNFYENRRGEEIKPYENQFRPREYNPQFLPPRYGQGVRPDYSNINFSPSTPGFPNQQNRLNSIFGF